MAETAVQTPICDICGAEVRDGSLFCYNCGGSVSASVDEKASKPAATVNGVNSGKPKAALDPRTRKRRASNRRPVEVIWEPRTGVSTGFVIGSLTIFLIAVVLFLVANYLK